MNLEQREAEVNSSLRDLGHAIDGITKKVGSVAEVVNGVKDFEARSMAELRAFGREAGIYVSRNRVPLLVSATILGVGALILRGRLRKS